MTGTGIVVSREVDRAALRRAVRRGEVRRLRPGGYLVVDDDAQPAGQRSDEAATLLAIHRQLDAPHVFSHASAAGIWGLRRWRVPARVDVYQGYRASQHAARDIARHFASLTDVDAVEKQGLPVTSPTRTVVDCALALHPLESLVIADAALAGGASRAGLLAELGSRGRARGVVRARTVLDAADGGAESVWETWLRYVALRRGLPRPTTQYAVATRLGTFRIDMAWPEQGVLAEFDGRIKYRDGAFGPGYDADDARFREKRRADAIEDATGRRLLRFTAADPEQYVGDTLVARLTAGGLPAPRPNPVLPPVPRTR